MPSFIKNLKDKLIKTHNAISGRVDDLLKYYKDIDDEFFEELEEILITADMGVALSLEIIADVKTRLKEKKTGDKDVILSILRQEIISRMDMPKEDIKTPAVILMVGVNGSGKTTTAAKLILLHKNER